MIFVFVHVRIAVINAAFYQKPVVGFEMKIGSPLSEWIIGEGGIVQNRNGVAAKSQVDEIAIERGNQKIIGSIHSSGLEYEAAVPESLFKLEFIQFNRLSAI